MYMDGCFLCFDVCAPCVYLVPQSLEESVGCPALGVETVVR